MDYYRLKVLNNKKKILGIIVFIIIVLFIGYYFFIYQHDELEEKEEIIIEEENSINSSNDIFVDIKGFVNNPGVYSFKSSDNARINDLISKAGGLKKEADTSTINLSKKIEDEMIIIIYSKNEISNYLKTQDDLAKKLEICETKLKNDACIKVNKEEKKDNKININKADLNELMTINGIGEAKAKAIIEYRKKNKFNSIDDIKSVEGIGENLFARIKESITV